MAKADKRTGEKKERKKERKKGRERKGERGKERRTGRSGTQGRLLAKASTQFSFQDEKSSNGNTRRVPFFTPPCLWPFEMGCSLAIACKIAPFRRDWPRLEKLNRQHCHHSSVFRPERPSKGASKPWRKGARRRDPGPSNRPIQIVRQPMKVVA